MLLAGSPGITRTCVLPTASKNGARDDPNHPRFLSSPDNTLGSLTAAAFRPISMSSTQPAILALEDGSVYHGLAFGAAATIAGECVFNTSMTGYQEILSDPSYFGQIVTMTAPQIGNYGITPADAEARTPLASGFVVRELSPIVSNWRSTESLAAYLARHGIPVSAK